MGRLNALVALAHIQGLTGDTRSAVTTFDDCRRSFDVAGSYGQTSDFDMPEWRFAVHESMLFARMGDERSVSAQETAERNIPAQLPRFKTHVELHRGLMLVRTGDAATGITYARNAIAKLPPEKHSLSLKLMMAEIERA